MGAVEPQFNGLPYNKVLGITNDIPAAPVMVKYLEKNLDIMEPPFCEHILFVPWPFVISGFHSTTIGPLVMIN